MSKKLNAIEHLRELFLNAQGYAGGGGSVVMGIGGSVVAAKNDNSGYLEISMSAHCDAF